MKTFGRRTLAAVMSLIMVLSCFAGLTFSVGAETSGAYEYKVLDDGTVEITRYNGNDTNVEIPSVISSKKVKRIGEYALSGNDELISVTISDGVEKINSYAFWACTNLTSITIPSSVNAIGKYAFSACTNLTSITIPGSVEIIDECAFKECTGLTSVTISDGVETIGYCAFEECTGLTSVTIPDSVKTFGRAIFYRCTGLVSVTISDGIEKIGDGAFSGCTGLTSITIPDSVKKIGMSAFWGCTGLTDIKIPNSVELIDSYAFYGCTGFTSITIPDSVKRIGDDVFYECTGLTSITIGKNVEYIIGIFKGCDSLKDINVADDNDNYKSVDGVVFNKDMTEICVYPTGRKGGYIIPDGVVSIGRYAFYYCRGLTDVSIPNSVTSVEEYAFTGCNGLTSITIGKGVEYIPIDFYECDKLNEINIDKDNYKYKSVDGVVFSKDMTEILRYPTGRKGEYVIPDDVTKIDYSAFEYCKELTSITIGKGVEYISNAFQGCDSLNEINIADGNNSYKSVDGVVFTKDMTEICVYPTGRKGEYVIPDGVTEISRLAFQDCTGLTSITIPDGVTKIVNWAFKDCTELTSITIPESVTEIEVGAFVGLLIHLDSVICGYPGTAAERYANDNGFKFVDLTPCSHSDVEIKDEKPATCVEIGYSGDKYCKKCGELLENGTEIPALGHSEITIKGKSATCTETGLTDGVKCSVCGKVIKAQKEIAAAGHKFNKGVCTVCGAIDPDYKVVLESVSENIKVDNKSKAAVFTPASSSGMKIAEFKKQFDGEISVDIDDNSLVANGTKFKFGDNEFTVIVKGDVQADGKITASDARSILRISAKLDKADDAGMNAADVNGDGKVTASEARRVLRFSAKLESSIA